MQCAPINIHSLGPGVAQSSQERLIFIDLPTRISQRRKENCVLRGVSMLRYERTQRTACADFYQQQVISTMENPLDARRKYDCLTQVSAPVIRIGTELRVMKSPVTLET